jgi:hypothetical protein
VGGGNPRYHCSCDGPSRCKEQREWTWRRRAQRARTFSRQPDTCPIDRLRDNLLQTIIARAIQQSDGWGRYRPEDRDLENEREFPHRLVRVCRRWESLAQPGGPGQLLHPDEVLRDPPVQHACDAWKTIPSDWQTPIPWRAGLDWED